MCLCGEVKRALYSFNVVLNINIGLLPFLFAQYLLNQWAKLTKTKLAGLHIYQFTVLCLSFLFSFFFVSLSFLLFPGLLYI